MPIADSLVAEIARLPKMTVGQMRARYCKDFPQAFRIPHKQHLVRRIAWHLTSDGYIYDGRPYNSLSAVARAVTGTRWNGLLFFGIAKRDKAATGGKARRAA